MIEATLTIGWGEVRREIPLANYRWEGDLTRRELSWHISKGSVPAPQGIPAGNCGDDIILLRPQRPPYHEPNPFTTVVGGLERYFGNYEVGEGTLYVQGSRETVPVHFLRVPESSYRAMNGDLTVRLQRVESTYNASPVQH